MIKLFYENSDFKPIFKNKIFNVGELTRIFGKLDLQIL